MAILSGHVVLAVDTETTGFYPAQGDRVTEVACVPVDDGAPGEGWSSLVHTSREIPAEVTRITGITPAMVAAAPAPAIAGATLRAACGERALAFHNAPFDLPFLAVLFAEAGVPPLANPVIDTLGLARGLNGTGGNSLVAVAKRLGVPDPDRAHRALDDARTTALVLVRLAAEWEERKGIRSLMELAAVSQDVMRTTGRR